MANRTHGQAKVIQIRAGGERAVLPSDNYTGQVYAHELIMRGDSGLARQAGPGHADALFEGVSMQDALSSAGDKLPILRKGKFKAVVVASDAAADAARAFRIKGSGTNNALVLADRKRHLYAEDGRTLTVAPADGSAPRCGYIDVITDVGTDGDGEAQVVLDADWAASLETASDAIADAALSISSQDFNGVDIGNRMVLTERFEQRPLLATAIDPNTAADPSQAEIDDIFGANRNFEIAGTNAANANITFNVARGGIRGATAGADNDQVIIQPRTNPANVTRWNAGFSSSLPQRWVTSLSLPAITAIRVKAALALTNAIDRTTDADQVGVMFDTGGGVSTANWTAIESVDGTDTEEDTGIAAAADAEVRVVIDIDANRVPRVYINEALVFTGDALAAGKTLKPFVSWQALTAAGKSVDVRFEAMSMKHAA